MKLTKSQLKQIIQEELEKVLEIGPSIEQNVKDLVTDDHIEWWTKSEKLKAESDFWARVNELIKSPTGFNDVRRGYNADILNEFWETFSELKDTALAIDKNGPYFLLLALFTEAHNSFRSRHDPPE